MGLIYFNITTIYIFMFIVILISLIGIIFRDRSLTLNSLLLFGILMSKYISIIKSYF